MNERWKYIKKLNNPKAVQDFLRIYKIDLPEQLIKFIEKNNGGRPIDPSFSTNKREGYVFKSLFSYNTEDLENIYFFYPIFFQNSFLYPIGMDSVGNYVCYDIQSKQYVLKLHETNECEIIDKKDIR